MKPETRYIKEHGLCQKDPAVRIRARIATGTASVDDYETEIKRLRSIYHSCKDKTTEYARTVLTKMTKYHKELDEIRNK